MNKDQAISSTSQNFLEIFDITNDLVILKDGSAGLILTVTAMNFGLLAEEEQDAIIYGYAGLLNSLNYSIQILIRSQTKDVTSYLNSLKLIEDETINRLKKDQIRKYREFVADLVQERNVLDKKFYVVIPASALELGLISTKSVIPGVKNPDISSFDRSMILERARDLLEPKRDHLMSQFARIGLLSRQLKTQEIIQLFYVIYNPEASDGQKITDSQNYTSTTVQGSMGEEMIPGSRSQRPVSMHPIEGTQPLQTQPDTMQIPPPDQTQWQVQEITPQQQADQQPQSEIQQEQPLPPPAEIV